MARARTIKPHFLHSRSMQAVSPMARLTFIQLWLLADDAGRMTNHRGLAYGLYPRDAESQARVPEWLDELEGQECIERYTVDGLPYLRIVNWRKHQKVYHPTPSRLPGRPASVAQNSGAAREAREALVNNPQNAAGPDLSPDFPSDSRGEIFTRVFRTASLRFAQKS